MHLEKRRNAQFLNEHFKRETPTRAVGNTSCESCKICNTGSGRGRDKGRSRWRAGDGKIGLMPYLNNKMKSKRGKT